MFGRPQQKSQNSKPSITWLFASDPLSILSNKIGHNDGLCSVIIGASWATVHRLNCRFACKACSKILASKYQEYRNGGEGVKPCKQ